MLNETEPARPIEVEHHRDKVVLWARRYARYGVPLEELVAAGNCGLVEAASRFDPTRGAAFATYAQWWIRKRMLDALHDAAGNLVGTRFRRQRYARVHAVRQDLAERLGGEPEIADLAREMGWRADTVRRTLEPIARLVPLEPDSDGSTPPEIARLSAMRSVSPLDLLIGRDGIRRLEVALGALPVREATVLLLRFGFGGGRPATLRRIGMRLGLTSERVRQIEANAIVRLRREVAGTGARRAGRRRAQGRHS